MSTSLSFVVYCKVYSHLRGNHSNEQLQMNEITIVSIKNIYIRRPGIHPETLLFTKGQRFKSRQIREVIREYDPKKGDL